MGRNKDTDKHLIRLDQPSGNPYASLSTDEDEEPRVCSEAADRQAHAYLASLQNPYAYHAIFDDAGQASHEPVAETTKISGPPRFGLLSKKDFEAQSRRIFLQYVPWEENRVLRPEHRDFIRRNASRAAEERYLLVEELRKYDLAAAGNYRPHFNRERDALTQEKLLEIERRVGSEKK